jgi:UDP-N-acetylglucosamine 2-epimerase (non-hydrolysing)
MNDHRIPVVVAYGTRPEAIKLAPVVAALKSSSVVRPVVVVSGQHREMLDQVNRLFGIVPDQDLDIITPGQTLTEITSRALTGYSDFLTSQDAATVVLQGDTTTTLAAALAAFYHQTPVVHVEAGLRTYNPRSPYPEEMNRRLTTELTALHLAPTPRGRRNLLRDGVAEALIRVTGNTVIDAFLDVASRRVPIRETTVDKAIAQNRRILLVTAHRRESWGEHMRAIGRAIATIARRVPDVLMVLPAHRNPLVRQQLLPPLAGLDNIVVTEPLDYAVFSTLIAASTLVLTDSGGIQEEAPSLGKPVLVMRDTTERPEAVQAGTVELVGTDEQRIVERTTRLLDDPEAYRAMANAVNPYGDGKAAQRSVAAIEALLGVGECIADFQPAE